MVEAVPGWYSPVGAAWKIVLFLSITALLVMPTALYTVFIRPSRSESAPTSLITAKLRQINVQGIGSVSEPILKLPIRTPDGTVEHEFLLDSGATISSLPYEMAEILGQNPAFLPRIAFRGFGNTTSFAYQSSVTIAVRDREVMLPVVFTEAKSSKSLLGRKGFFDSFTVVFDHEGKLVDIRG